MSFHIRRGTTASLAAGAALFLGTTLGLGAVAMADELDDEVQALTGPPGDNGTVKVHDPDRPDEDNRNEPKVCDFKLIGNGFDGLQSVSWTISVHGGPPAGRVVALEGEIELDEDGHGATEILELPNGHYKLDWTFEGQQSADAKHKVFKVTCADPTAPPTDEPTDEPTDTPTDEPTDTPTDAPTEEPTDEPTEGETPKEPGEEVPADEKPQAGGGLPVTGAALAGLVAAGVAAIGGGGAAVYFGRKRRPGAESDEG